MAMLYWAAQLPPRVVSRPSPVTFEILNLSLVCLGCFAASESPKIAPFARLGILLA